MKTFVTPCLKNFSKIAMFISFNCVQADIELSKTTFGEEGQIFVEMSVTSSFEDRIYEPQLCTYDEQKPKVCYQASKALIAGGKKVPIAWSLPGYEQSLWLEVSNLLGNVVGKNMLAAMPVMGTLVRIENYTLVHESGHQYFNIAVMVHKAPVNIAIQTGSNSTIYQRAFLLSGMKSIQFQSQEQPSHIVYAGPGAQSSVRQALPQARSYD